MCERRDVSILVVDDHPLFRLGLRLALTSLGFGTVDEAGGGEAALAMYRRRRHDALVLDVRMPKLNGLEVARVVKDSSEGPPPIVIVLSTYSEPAIVQRASQCGVYAFKSKDTEPSDLADVIDRGLRGVASPLAVPRDLPELTQREMSVLRSLANGASVREVASRLGISPETVKDHVASVYGKLGVHDRVSMVRVAREFGWLLLDEMA